MGSRHLEEAMFMRLFVLLAVLTLAVRSGTAQEATGLMTADEQMVDQLLKARSVAELDAEYQTAKQRAAAADKDLTEASALLASARSRVEVKKGEIDLLKKRLKLARKEKDSAAQAEVQTLLPREEQVLRVFVAMRDAGTVQKDRAEAAVAFAHSRVEMLEAERTLTQKRDDRVAQTMTTGEGLDTSEIAKIDAEIRDAARKAANALKDYANRSKRLAESTGDLAAARLELLEAWESYKGR
jgi:hypothetical protein